ncbi:MAG: DUF3108 domain-containing protein, partial [Myxococcota bacterium]|nr:DUF3108 domain-containing protein [Myxococcota bacterium]
MIPNTAPQNRERVTRQQITSAQIPYAVERTRCVLLSLVCFLLPSVATWAAPTRPTPARASQGKASPSARAAARRRQRQKNRRTPVNIKRPERALKAPPALGPIPFPVGEHLVYKVNAMSLNAGTATLKVGPRGTRNGRPVVQLSAKITSSPLLEELYRIRDRATVLARED